MNSFEDLAKIDKNGKYFVSKEGKIFSTQSGKIKEIKLTVDKDGRCGTTIRENGKKINMRVHRLVAEKFLNFSGDLRYYRIIHKDGNKQNNHYKNLILERYKIPREPRLKPDFLTDKAFKDSEGYQRYELLVNLLGRQFGVDECWEWRGSLNSNGYGQIVYKGKSFGTHRVLFEVCGIDPRSLDENGCVDHICMNKKCFNPMHLRMVDTRTNNLENSNSLARVYKEKNSLY